MKSIMQEASSITKAIEKAWISAGKPKEFSVKVFEEPKRNFIGMVVQSAKIGIFFNEQHVSHEPSEHYRPKERIMPKKQQQPVHQPKKYEQNKNVVKREEFTQGLVWAPEMVDKACQWMKGALSAMNLSTMTFVPSADQYTLTLTFNGSLVNDRELEKQLFKNFSFLMLQSLKRTFKRPLRGFKIS